MRIAKFKVEEWVNKYEASAQYDLCTTCISPLSVNELLEIAGQKDLDIFDEPLAYGEIHGSARLKKAISSIYTNQNIENITVTHGGIGANQLVFLSLLEPKDEIISVIPTYQQLYSIPESLKANVKLLFLKEENSWHVDLEELEKKISSKTKVICLNNPNNPTGAVLADSELEKIVEIARKHDIWIMVDEAYRGLNHEGKPYSKSIADIYEKGISTGSMSKTYSLPGLRLGWICASQDLIKEINHQREYNTISVSIIDEYFAAIALENKEKIAKRNLKIILENKKILTQWLEKDTNFECIIPNSGTTAFVKFKKDIPTQDFCKKLQEATSVALLPGETFEMEGYFRLGYCIPTEKLEKSLELISHYTRTIAD